MSDSPSTRLVRGSHRSVTRLLLCGAALASFAVGAPAVANGNPGNPPEVAGITCFNAALLETPESIAIDSSGNKYISMALTGEIRKIAVDGTQSTHAVLPLGAPPLSPCGSFIGIMGAIAHDQDDNLYASVGSCNEADRGVWKISPTGETTLVANLSIEALPNGIAHRKQHLYVADSALGLVWKIPADGNGPPEIWSDDPLLMPSVGHVFPGPNGAQFHRNELYISNSDQGTILAIEVMGNGTAGNVRVHATGVPCDDFAFDMLGNMYCTTDPFGTVVRIAPDGSSEIILTVEDGLDGPSAATFGKGKDRFTLYVTNAAFPFFSTAHQPSLMEIRMPVPGAHQH